MFTKDQTDELLIVMTKRCEQLEELKPDISLSMRFVYQTTTKQETIKFMITNTLLLSGITISQPYNSLTNEYKDIDFVVEVRHASNRLLKMTASSEKKDYSEIKFTTPVLIKSNEAYEIGINLPKLIDFPNKTYSKYHLLEKKMIACSNFLP